jgi:hypothetical protein
LVDSSCITFTNLSSTSPLKIAFISFALKINSNLPSLEAHTTSFVYLVSTTSQTSAPKAMMYVLILTFQKEKIVPSNIGGLLVEVPSWLVMFKLIDLPLSDSCYEDKVNEFMLMSK